MFDKEKLLKKMFNEECKSSEIYNLEEFVYTLMQYSRRDEIIQHYCYDLKVYELEEFKDYLWDIEAEYDRTYC